MRCENCAEPTNIRFFVPIQNPVRRMLNSLAQNLREGKWVCEKCLREKEKM